MRVIAFCIFFVSLSGIFSSNNAEFAFGKNHAILSDKADNIHLSNEFIIPDRLLASAAYRKPKPSEQTSGNAVEPPLLIGSFNIQTLTPKKFDRPDIMSVVEKVILRYDLILIMEIITNDWTEVERFRMIINRLAPPGVVYNMSLSAFHPRTRERCAFFYRADKLNVLKTEMYLASDNVFFRRPYIVHFKALTLRDMDEFVAIGHHVQPKRAVIEMNRLPDVFDYIRNEYKVEDTLLLGDLNADCSYVREEDWENITLWTRTEFVWPITHNIDTTTNHRSCALDRFVFTGRRMNDGVIMSSAGVFNFQQAYGLTLRETRAVSDHWPIEIQIRGKMSAVAEKNLFSLSCFTVSDLRTAHILDLQNTTSRAKAAGFAVTGSAQHWTFVNSTTTEDNMLKSLKGFHDTLPEMISEEQFQAAVYKVRYGGMHDKSSFVDVQKPMFYITVTLKNQIKTVTICRRTTVN